MKQLISLAMVSFLFNPVFAQEFTHEIPTHKMSPTSTGGMGRIESPAYLDSTLFAIYLNWNLQSDSLTMQGKPAKGDTIMIRYIVSKEGKISFAEFPGKEKSEFINFVQQKLLNCPYQWSPAYQNGRAVNHYGQIRIVF